MLLDFWMHREARAPGRGSRRGQIAAAKGAGLILEDRHGRGHPPEAQALVKPFLARDGVEDDLAMAAAVRKQTLDDVAAKTSSLAVRMHGDIAEVGAVAPVG